ncbi:NADH dehydrogenase [ubiquinone] flavoprotein 3, mitochondrial [Cydia splendana]|uniref:NADH dehydrogenase [ubiquinone] flavoprotein 3, mitochondrial n=1 Tax=Cydia splendana TaxID=1100963 RepID=UPI00300CAC3C
MFARTARNSNALRLIPRYFSEGSSQGSAPSASASAGKVNANVPGLSQNCIAPASQPVGPGVDPKKSGPYKVPEYYLYNNMSYFEAEIEMSKYRCPQPSALRK